MAAGPIGACSKLLRLQIELHTPTRRLGKVRQCRKVCLEIRCYSHMVGCGRTPKLLGVLDAWRQGLPCKTNGRCEESSNERCCNLGGNDEVCRWVGCCSQDYVSSLPRCLMVLLGQAAHDDDEMFMRCFCFPIGPATVLLYCENAVLKAGADWSARFVTKRFVTKLRC